MPNFLVARVAPWIPKSSWGVDSPTNLAVLCLVAAALFPVARVDAQCVGGAPDGNADVSEDCDDGNTATGDGCTNSCTVEPDWSAANAITFSSGAINTNDYGSNSSWTFAADNSWARQDNNTDGPAIGLFGVDAMRGTYALELEVETINDDDFIGIVFGFNDGDPSNSNANYLLLDWKQADQNVSGWGFGAKGLAVSHVQGIPTAGSFWSHSCPSPGACVNELQRSAALGDTGWTDNSPHNFHVTYRADRLLVMVDGFVQFDISPSDFPGQFAGDVFPAGEIGFYSYSQASSTTRNIGTIGASVLNTTTVSDGNVYVDTGSGTTTINISDYFSDSDDSLDPNLILVTGVTGAATATDPTSGAPSGTIEVTPDDDTVATSYAVTYTACDDHPIVPDCDTATVTVHYDEACGNGIIETDEGCDDGNTTAGDGCGTTCLLEDDQSCTAGAECESTVCDTLGSNTCEQVNVCGNGVLEPGQGEVCDDGGTDDGDGCSDNCLLEEGGLCTLGTQCATGQCDADGLGCVACFDDQTGTAIDSGCGGLAPYCDASVVFPFCVAGCADDGSGATDIGCSGSDNACDESRSNPICVDCTETADCALGDACDVATHSCVEGCFEDSDCRDVGAALCDTSVSTPGACVTCFNDQAGANPDEGCTNAALPICNGATGEAGSACVFCLDDMGSGAMDTGCTTAGMGLCDTSVPGSACVECLADQDCPGLQVCTDDDACDYPDRDGDGFRDDVDVDDDGDGIVDTEEGDGTDWSADQDADGVPDYADPDEVSCADEEPDGICDSLPTDMDGDGDGLPNHLDLDADGDGLPDTTEGHDADGDGIADSVAVDNDDDVDGLDDAFDPDCAGMPGACTADGIVAPVSDRDGDGAPDYLDADSDNDGLLDRVEGFDGDADGQPEALPSGVDADGDGLDDAFDLDQGGIVATGQDRDSDGLPDYLDQDSDGDGIADRVECGDPTACVDSDGDGPPDFLDTDSDDDGIVDAIEGHDVDGDGAPDFEPLGMDEDEDGLDDAYDIDMAGGVPATLPDHDGDGTPDYQDPDDDGDGIGSAFECPDVLGCPDADSDDVPDYLDPDSNPDDTDGDGIPDAVECEGDIAACRDTDGDGSPDHMDPDDDDDGIPTATECGSSPDLCDGDGDGLPNHRDIDSDGDGITDSVECSISATCEDSDSNSTPDYLDEDADGDGIVDLVEGHDADMNGVADRTPLNSDTDGDGLDDAFDADDGGTTAPTQDTDGDTVPDFQDADDDDDGIDTVFECSDPGAGCPNGDADTTPDYLDAGSTAPDTDGDGIPDVVECAPPGDPAGDPSGCPDTDGDGMPNFNDPDDDDDGIDTADENYDGDNDPTNEDSDGDGTPDYLDTDDDDDGAPTVDECADFVAACADSDGDGRPDYLDVCGDDTFSVIDLASGWEECDDGNAVDGDGCDSSCRRESDVPDSDGDGIPDDVECPAPGSPMQPATCSDTDGDGTPDFDDEDDDGDGIDTADESPDGDSDPTDDDTDGDGTPNYLDEDDDGDGIDTADEIAASDVVENDDLDGDGVVNWLDTDSDGDGIDDGDEAEDADGNGVPDYLEDIEDPSGPGRLILQGGRGVGCHVGVPGEGSPNGVLLLLLLGFGLGIRRYRRN
jgi:cysteine-rich repeat protein